MIQRKFKNFPTTWPQILLLGLLFLISACTPKVDQSEIIMRDNIVYLKGHHEPFSGIVVGKGKEDYRKFVSTYEKHYKNGLLNGDSKYWYENGKLESRVPYKMGEINGIVTRYYENGKVKARIHFVDGLRGGEKGEMFWDENGKRVKR